MNNFNSSPDNIDSESPDRTEAKLDYYQTKIVKLEDDIKAKLTEKALMNDMVQVVPFGQSASQEVIDNFIARFKEELPTQRFANVDVTAYVAKLFKQIGNNDTETFNENIQAIDSYVTEWSDEIKELNQERQESLDDKYAV